jgi:hypothetical protein
MSTTSWVWFIILFIILWAIPVRAFFYEPKREVNPDPDWSPTEYEEYKFRRGPEILLISLVCMATTWLTWLGVVTKVLVWK